jgi:hypothetical protein
MKQEFEWEVVHEPKSFVATFRHLTELLEERSPHKTSDSVATFMREIRLDVAADMLTKAHEAYQSRNIDHAWYFLTQASEAIGYLHASQDAVYPRVVEPDLRSFLSEGGRKGGKKKGENAKKIEDEIVKKLRSAKPHNKKWDKATIRKEYNKIIDNLVNYNDSDRKWRAIFKREEIQKLLPQDEG